MEHKEHIRIDTYSDLITFARSPSCATCSTPDHLVPWDQMHRDWEAQRDMCDLLEQANRDLSAELLACLERTGSPHTTCGLQGQPLR